MRVINAAEAHLGKPEGFSEGTGPTDILTNLTSLQALVSNKEDRHPICSERTEREEGERPKGFRSSKATF